MVTRCIHMPVSLCSGCQERALRREDDRDWMYDESNQDWVFNPNIVRNSMGKPVGMMPHARTDVGKPPVFRGPQSTAGGIMQPMMPTQPGSLNAVHHNANLDPLTEKVVRYQNEAAQQQTIRQMPADLTKDEAEKLQAHLEAALHDSAEWQRIAQESLKERRAMSERHHAQLDQIERNQPTTASKMEVEKMPEKRVGDSDRNKFIEHLGNMFADGHLSEAEFGERADKANEALYMSQLRPLVADLPDMPAEKPKTGIWMETAPHKPARVKNFLAQPMSPVIIVGFGAAFALLVLILSVFL